MSWVQPTVSLKEEKVLDAAIQYVWVLLLRPCEAHEQSVFLFFSWQIMFTSKFKNTHTHILRKCHHIFSEFCLGTSVANTAQHLVSSLSTDLSLRSSRGTMAAGFRLKHTRHMNTWIFICSFQMEISLKQKTVQYFIWRIKFETTSCKKKKKVAVFMVFYLNS